jgi:hypothetical protein
MMSSLSISNNLFYKLVAQPVGSSGLKARIYMGAFMPLFYQGFLPYTRAFWNLH